MRCFVGLFASIGLLIVLPWGGIAAAGDDKGLQVGDRVPQFCGIDDNGQIWESHDHIGQRVLVFYFYPLATCFWRRCVSPVVGLPQMVVGRETCHPPQAAAPWGSLNGIASPWLTPRRALNEISSRYLSGDDILFCNLAEYACRLTKVRSRTSLFSSSLPSS